jgi:O-antigen ligase
MLVLLLTTFIFGQLLRVNVWPDVTIHLNDILVGIVGGIGLIRGIRKIPRAWWLWAGAMILSLLVNIGQYPVKELLVSSLYLVRWLAYAGLFFALANLKDKVLLKKGLVIVALTVAFLGIAQYLLLPDVSFLAAQNWDDHYFRLVSTFLDPGFTGIILVLGLILIFQKLPLASVIFTALLLTYSRASYLAYLVGFTALSYFKKSVKIILVAGLILVLSIPLLPKTSGEGTKLGRENSVFARLNNWQEAVGVWQRAPVFGVGFDAYRYATGATLASHAGAGADSSLLLVLATTGIVGFLAYLNVLRWMWFRGKLLFRVSFLAVLVHSWFNNTLFYPWAMEWLWLLLILDG